MTANLNLWPIGNCQVSALIDERGRYVWGCAPRADGDPLFCSLLDSADTGFWDVELEGRVSTEQRYLDDTPVLVTRHTTADGAAIEITDFCPRSGEQRPVAFARIVRPVAGAPRIRIRLRPASAWGASETKRTREADHLRYDSLRLTTNADLADIETEAVFALTQPIRLHLGAAVETDVDAMLEQTLAEWRSWVGRLSLPSEWRDVAVRSAITLKLCQHEETGALLAAMTTSIPEHADSGRNWDYRYCWVRDSYYTVQALDRLGAVDVRDGYLAFLRTLVEQAEGGPIQPLFGIGGETRITERQEPGLKGYRGMGPVRVGNAAYSQVQHDAYGQILLSHALAPATEADFRALEPVGDMAFTVYDQPDAGLWELRTKSNVHTYSAAMCWAACDRLSRMAAELGLDDRARFWSDRAATMRTRIEQAAWRPDTNRISATFGDDILDASLLQLLDIGFLEPGDPRFLGALAAIESELRRGSHMLRYAVEDDFGLPKTAFNVCTFWLIEALWLTGRHAEARGLFEEMLTRLTPSGLLSEDIDPATGELWGNFPQTYSLVGLINCAVLLGGVRGVGAPA
jgi:GH15 family glucan-1,4-alpha-glucosidase